MSSRRFRDQWNSKCTHRDHRKLAAARLRLETLEARTLMDAGMGAGIGDLYADALVSDRFADQIALDPGLFMSVPQLSSRPGADQTLYLDFNGHFERTWSSDGWT